MSLDMIGDEKVKLFIEACKTDPNLKDHFEDLAHLGFGLEIFDYNLEEFSRSQGYFYGGKNAQFQKHLNKWAKMKESQSLE